MKTIMNETEKNKNKTKKKLIPKPFFLLLVTSLQIPKKNNNVCNINCCGVSAERKHRHNLHFKKKTSGTPCQLA